jgi:CHAT domain-containing protein
MVACIHLPWMLVCRCVAYLSMVFLAAYALHPAAAMAAEAWEEETEILAVAGEMFAEKRQYREGLEMLGDAFREYLKKYGPGHAATATAQNLLAKFFLQIYQPVSARENAVGAILHMESAVGESALRLAPFLTDLAEANEHLGDWLAARTAINRARDIVQRHAPRSGIHALVLRQSARIALAASERDLGPHFDDLQQALNIIGANDKLAEYELTPTLELVADFVIRAAATLPGAEDRRKLLESARASMEQVVNFRSKGGREAGPALIGPLHRLAVIARESGDFAAAERYFALAMMQIMKHPVSFRAPGTLNLVRDVIIMDARRNRHALLPGYCHMLLRIMEDVLAVRLGAAEEDERVRIAAAVRADFSFCLEVFRLVAGTDNRQDAVRSAMDWVLRSKSIVLDVQAHFLSNARSTPEGARALAELNDLKRAAVRAPAVRGKPDAAQDRITALQLRLAQLRLGGATDADMDEVIGAIKLDDVANALPRNGVLIEFARTPEFEFQQARASGRYRYLAFVLGHGKRIDMIDLGDAAVIDAAIHSANAAIRGMQDAMNPKQLVELHLRAQERLAKLYRLVWHPVAGAVGSMELVMLSPDGELNLAPFAALGEKEGAPLIERHQLVYVTSGRDLLRSPLPARPAALDLLLLADPAFDAAPVAREEIGARVRAYGVQAGVFGPLPGTALEAKELPALVPGEPALKRVATGADASVETLLGANGPRVLHIATHGFFLQGDTRLANPLMRSGLAFAGANRAGEDGAVSSGILTAYEITGLDLKSTELAVLSACETGIGVVGAGEGVFGLRRAFVLAGARALMMSLWPVADDVTSRQMRTFYQKRRDMSAAQALRQAQLETIQWLKVQHGVAPAFFWAPFFIQGATAFRR